MALLRVRGGSCGPVTFWLPNLLIVVRKFARYNRALVRQIFCARVVLEMCSFGWRMGRHVAPVPDTPQRDCLYVWLAVTNAKRHRLAARLVAARPSMTPCPAARGSPTRVSWLSGSLINSGRLVLDIARTPEVRLLVFRPRSLSAMRFIRHGRRR